MLTLRELGGGGSRLSVLLARTSCAEAPEEAEVLDTSSRVRVRRGSSTTPSYKHTHTHE